MGLENMYKYRSFDIISIHADKDFVCLRENIRPTGPNISDADDHIYEVDRLLRISKEQLIYAIHCHTKIIPRFMIRRVVENSTNDLN